MALQIREIAGSDIGADIAVGFLNESLRSGNLPFRIPSPTQAAANKSAAQGQILKQQAEFSSMKVIELVGWLQNNAEATLGQISPAAEGSQLKIADLVGGFSELGRFDTAAIFDEPEKLISASQVVADIGRELGDPLLEALRLQPADLLRFQTSGVAGTLRGIKTTEEIGAEKLARTAATAKNLGIEGGLPGIVEDVTGEGEALGQRLEDTLEDAGVDVDFGLDTNIDEAAGASKLRTIVNGFIDKFGGLGMDPGFLYGAVLQGDIGKEIEAQLNNLDTVQDEDGFVMPLIEDRADIDINAQKELLSFLSEAARARGLDISVIFAELGLPFQRIDQADLVVSPDEGV
jgi:hypothetical protein